MKDAGQNGGARLEQGPKFGFSRVASFGASLMNDGVL